MKAILAGAVFLFAWGSAQGVCMTASPPANTNSPSDFLMATVRSLEQFQSAYSEANAIGAAKSGMEMLTPFDAASESLDCASDTVENFKSANDEGIKVTGHALQAAASMLAKLNVLSKKSVVAELNGDYAKEKPGDHAARAASLAQGYHQAWEMLPTAATAAVLSVVEFESPDSKKLGRLAITSEQRDTLNAEIASGFPRSVGDDLPSDRSWPEVAAYILYFGLNKKGWPTQEQPFPVRATSGR